MYNKENIYSFEKIESIEDNGDVCLTITIDKKNYFCVNYYDKITHSRKWLNVKDTKIFDDLVHYPSGNWRLRINGIMYTLTTNGLLID